MTISPQARQLLLVFATLILARLLRDQPWWVLALVIFGMGTASALRELTWRGAVIGAAGACLVAIAVRML